MPSYHDLHITTAEIERTSVFNLPYGLQVTCTRTGGWELWDMNATQPGGGRIKPSRGVLIAGEYSSKWLVLDVAGVVIVDSREAPVTA
jgi:hypothetical protein